MLIDSTSVLIKLQTLQMYYLNQGRYAKAEALAEAISDVQSLERRANENEKRVYPEPSKGESDSIP